ncbi:hypothetical protein [Aeromicrobium chenweiae]|nr:hypothetical protein [Aeromicrobium chenweiae]
MTHLVAMSGCGYVHDTIGRPGTIATWWLSSTVSASPSSYGATVNR